MEKVLKGWFERQITGCGKDPKVYDFSAEVDRSLTYKENKAKFEAVVQQICGPKPPSKREQKAAQYAAEGEATKCPVCPLSFHYSKKLGSSAEEQYKAHLAYERSKGRLSAIPSMAEQKVNKAREREEKEREYELYGEY